MKITHDDANSLPQEVVDALDVLLEGLNNSLQTLELNDLAKEAVISVFAVRLIRRSISIPDNIEAQESIRRQAIAMIADVPSSGDNIMHIIYRFR